MHVSEYKAIIEDLRKEIDNLRTQVHTKQPDRSTHDILNSEM
jgi:ribosomal protein L29